MTYLAFVHGLRKSYIFACFRLFWEAVTPKSEEIWKNRFVHNHYRHLDILKPKQQIPCIFCERDWSSGRVVGKRFQKNHFFEILNEPISIA